MRFGKSVLRILLYIFIFLCSISAQDPLIEKIDSVNSIPYDYIVSNVRESINIFTKNLEASREADYKEGIARSSINLGLAYYISGQYDKSTSAYLNAINKYEELQFTEDLASTFGEFGYQLKRRNLPKANLYMMEGIRIAEANQFDSTLAKLYDNYGVLKEMEGNLDSASFFYNRSLDIKVRRNDTIGIPYSLNKLAGVSAMKGNFENALSFMKQSDKYREEEKGSFGRIENLVLYGDIYRTKGDTTKAIEYYESGLAKSIEQDINYLIRYCYQQLTQLYEAQGKYEKALDALNAYTVYKDSVLDEEVQLKVAELELDYQTEKKDRQIAESKLELSERTSQLYLLIGLAALLVLISFALYVYQKRKREKLVLENKLRQAELVNRLSEEQLRISRELHDNIGSQLTFMVSSIDNYTYKLKEAAEPLNKISEFGRDTLKELRNTIWALKHVGANVNDLILKARELTQKINGAQDKIEVNVNSEIDENKKLSAVQMLNLYRIIQESVQNTVKHADASKIEINFVLMGSNLSLIIKDNGKGFDLDKIKKGNGLESMQRRCEECGGVWGLESSESGTSISCSVALN